MNIYHLNGGQEFSLCVALRKASGFVLRTLDAVEITRVSCSGLMEISLGESRDDTTDCQKRSCQYGHT